MRRKWLVPLLLLALLALCFLCHSPTPYSHTSASWGCPQS